MSSLPPEPTAPPPTAPTPPPTRKLRVPFVFSVLLLAAVVMGVTLWRNSRSDNTRKDALTAADQGRFATVEPTLRALAAQNPNDVAVIEALARGYSETDNTAEAETFLTRLVELKSTDPNVLRLRYEFYRKTSAAEKAYADGKRILEVERPDSPLRRQTVTQFRRTILGQAFSLGHFEDAESLCQAALREAPNDPNLRATMAEICRMRGDFVGAAEILDKLREEDPANTRVMTARANLYLDSGEPEKAVPLLEEVLKKDRTRQRTAGAQLVVAYERTGQTEKAQKVAAEVRKLQDVEVYGEAMKSQPDNLDIRVRLAERLFADGHADEALATLKAVLAIDPHHRPAHLALAGYYEKQNQPALAAEHRKLAGPNP